MTLIEGNYYYYYYYHLIFILSLYNVVNSPWTRLNYDIEDGYDDDGGNNKVILLLLSLLDTPSYKIFNIP